MYQYQYLRLDKFKTRSIGEDNISYLDSGVKDFILSGVVGITEYLTVMENLHCSANF